jgi:manganese oxidase
MERRDGSRLLVLFVFGVMIFFALPGPSEAAAQTCTPANTVFANVVAIDQPIMNNRLGAHLTGGMIYALARDVCARSNRFLNKQPLCDPDAASINPDNVMLKPYKRPRPLVLRVNQGQCLQLGFTNLLTPTAPQNHVQPSTRAASVHVQGLELVNTTTCGNSGTGPMCNDGSWVGNNPSGLVSPPATALNLAQPQITYTLYAQHEGSFLLYSTAETFTESGTPSKPGSGVGDGGQLAFGLFGAVHVEPADAEWYRSQVTGTDLEAAKLGTSTFNQPLIKYQAVYPKPTGGCFEKGTCRVGPVLRMACTPDMAANPDNRCQANEIVHSDLTAVITGPHAGRFPAERPEGPTLKSSFSLPDRLQPFREFTIIYHEMFNITQFFQDFYNASTTIGNGNDAFGINYGTAGIGSEVLANRIGVGPMANCTSCKFEEFFLTSWAVGDPAMVVDSPPQCKTDQELAASTLEKLSEIPKPPPIRRRNEQAVRFPLPNVTCHGQANLALFPDDPSNVYHSYISDHTTFRILHGGSDLHHVHHQHAHQWLHSPDTSNGDYLDSQSIGPGSAFSLEMVFNGSGNVNQTIGDSIFHCHFYPHFAAGMWSLWRVHDVYETGTQLQDGRPAPGSRALPDGDIIAGTPIPAVVPLPTIPMAPMPAQVRLVDNGKRVEICDDQGKDCVSALDPRDPDPKRYRNPGFPFFIPGLGGQRAPHPPYDFAHEIPGDLNSPALDGGLPRHLILPCKAGPNQCSTIALLNDYTDFSKTLNNVQAVVLPELGTFAEKLKMNFHGQRLIDSMTPEGKSETVNGYDPPNLRPAKFIVNNLPPISGAPYADPCIKYSLEGGHPFWTDQPRYSVRKYKAADIQLDVTFNKEGWHFPQQRMLALWGDVADYLKGTKPPEPFFFRADSGDCIEYTLANLVPNVYELDDFQVRTPTDVIGQHIHLVKFDVTSSDGATNGFNYEDGTFAPNEVTERIVAIRAGNGCKDKDPRNGTFTCPVAKPIPFFGPGPGGQWMGAQATIQRWYTDRLFDNTYQHPGVDRTLRTVFTHDHFGPSTHQQAGLYAGLVIEPNDSVWYHNDAATGDKPFGGDDASSQPLPSRTVTGYDGHTTQDGGPTTWQAVIVNPKQPNASFREFLLEFQDTTLSYAPFQSLEYSASVGQGFCSDNPATPCTPATAVTANQPGNGGCGAGAVCYSFGFCSTAPTASCRPATATMAEDVSACPATSGVRPTCNQIPGIPSTNAQTAMEVFQWPTTPIDNSGVELITLANGTNSFSVNYRNEPLFPRVNTGNPNVNDLSFAYASLDRGSLRGICEKNHQLTCLTSAQCNGNCILGGFCSDNNAFCTPQHKLWCASAAASCGPYPYAQKPPTPGVEPGDPFTPLLRAYAGDDVQIRTLVGAHINPHNFTVHGVKWLEEPSFVDSGWRNSQEMGISEHFEEIVKLPAVTGAVNSDYLYMAGAAAIEQAGGNWGLMRAYAKSQPDLKPLPQNQNPATAPVCPPNLPKSQQRSYTVVALTAAQALQNQAAPYKSQLVYNTRGPIADPYAILYFQLADLINCPGGKPGPQCQAKKQDPDPLVLRADAGDCLTVTLYNAVQSTLGTGATSPISTPSPALSSSTSTAVGLHPQLVSFDATKGDGFNAGNNPVQTVAALASGGTASCPADANAQVNCATYTWYAGNIDPTAQAGKQHIPNEFGAANLLPSDTINHHQYGLFGALIIEPAGATCGGGQPIETCTGTSAQITSPGQTFKEFVLITQDGLQGPTGGSTATTAQYFQLLPAWLGGDNFNAVNYRSEPLFLPGPNPQVTLRSCTSSSADLSCVLSSTAAQCCTSFTTNTTTGSTVCATSPGPAPCGDAQTPIFQACAGEQVRFRVLQAGGINTNNVFEVYGHVWQEQPYMSSGKGCPPPTTHTNLYSSSVIGTGNGCGPLEQDTYSEYQGSRMGHGPSNHFDALIESAGGANQVPGDYLYRSYPADHFRLGLWGIFRVLSNTSNACTLAKATGGGKAVGGGGR